ncbi:anthranilate phosphoribosyltransferase [Prochlorococcus sp. MIT 1341]|uniref:anthranilate phosphoribosyltransferase n=1 Tax=Prochlorococcus sp. MIT 1341 TaxID=3096221 RepID=UPI002A75BC07|nr:anthranilate phosphoribosyltransferase [Prochlorococcus sp. MIT 1341]
MTYSSVSFPITLEHLISGQNLSEFEASSVMNAWLKEQLSPVQTGAMLVALRMKGLTGEELAAMARVLQNACPLPCEIPKIDMVDTCGTGGDGANTFNISTAVAFTAAACGVNVAKHGNRSASGKVGSADVLEGLGLHLKAPLSKVVEALPQTGVTFLFAPAWHPALVNLAPLRKNLGIRTVFNLLGPLVNPLRPASQVLGVAREELLDPMAEALNRLGLRRAVVVHGAGGIDEASLAGPNHLRLLDGGIVKKLMLDPSDLNLETFSMEDLKGGDVETNKYILSSILKGAGTDAQRNVVALNTSLVLWAARLQDDFQEGFEIAKDALSKGTPWSRFEQLQKALL